MRSSLRVAATTLLATTAVLMGSATAIAARGAASTPVGDGAGPGSAEASHFPPVVQRTGKAPTGYSVTFRYWAPQAKTVKVTGEWSFSSPAHSTTTSSQDLAPSQWSPGDFPMVHPNTLAGLWPAETMAKGPNTGVWSYTVPLPSGVFTYGFLVNCAAPTGAGCKEVADPSNLPWNTTGEHTTGSQVDDSQVFVPADAAFKTVNYSWESPNPVHGSLVDVAYGSTVGKMAAGDNRLVIYTPPGYDPRRVAPYPALYLSHGYGGNEVDWSTTGDVSNILDNLISSGQLKPLVVIMTNFNGFAATCVSNEVAWATEYGSDLLDNVVPYVQAHYRVSVQPSERAFAGLSCGGTLAGDLLVAHTGKFGYYGVMSPYGSATGPTPAEAKLAVAYTASRRSTLNKVGIFVGGGLQDPIHATAAAEVSIFKGAGIRFSAEFIDGGHEWYVWRILLRAFLTRVAFLPLGR